MKNFGLLLTLVAIAIGSIAQNDTGELIDKIIAVVGDEIILYSELEIQALQATQGQEVPGEMYCNIMEESLFQKVLLHQARIDSIEISDEFVNSEVERRLQQYIQVFGSVEAFEAYYTKSIAEWKEEFKDPVREQMMAQQMEQTLFGNVRVTPGEVREFYNEIPKDSLPLINSTLEYSMIKYNPVVSPSVVDSTKSLLDSLRTYFLGLPNAGDIPGKFAVQAAIHSEDPGSKYKGGCYPLQSRGSFVPEFEAAVYNTPVGSVSNVFETVYGYHIVHVKDILGEAYESCHILITPKATSKDNLDAELKIKQIYQDIQNDSISFNMAATKYSSDERTKNQNGKVISNYTGSSKIEIKEMDQNIFFVLDQLEPGEVSEPVFLQPQGENVGAWYIFRLDKRNDAHAANLEIDYQIFKSQAENVKKKKTLDEWIDVKIDETYIWIDEDLKSCQYNYNWLRNAETE